MSYLINKTDGSVLTEIIDGNIDQIATDLTLIGKNSSSYGEYLNENLVHLLENFANTTQPNHPIVGQLWYDTVEKRLKVYDDTSGFKLTSSTIVSPIIPSSIAQGDIWIDSKRSQLYFNDGVSTILAGPYDSGVTGFNVLEVLDVYGTSHSIITLRINSSLFAILSETTFVPDSDVLGFSGTIKIGLNLINTSVITNVANPVDDADAVNNITLINAGKLAPLQISVDISNFTNKNDSIISEYLDKLFPVDDYGVPNVAGPVCRVICTDTTTDPQVTIRRFILDSTWQYLNNL